MVMIEPAERISRPRSSRQRYRGFVEDYKRQRLDEKDEADKNGKPGDDAAKAEGDAAAPEPTQRRSKRREYVREYIRWLWPHRFAVAAVFALALVVAGLEMIEPLFMRYIIDRVLLNGDLDTDSRL